MKKFRLIKSTVIVTSALASLLAPLSAFAIPYQGATVYKAMDGANQVVVFSGTPGSRVSVSLGSVPKSTARIAGACGEVRISVPASGDFTGLQVDGSGVDAASLPTQTLPSCVSGSFSEARNENFKTPSGQVVIVGLNPGAAVAISLPTASTRSVSVNACGFGVLKPTSTSGPIPDAFSVGTENYTLAGLPDATSAPYCRTVNGTPYGYVPASWMQ